LFFPLRGSRAGRAHRPALVEQQLAACVNILPGVQSIYRWQGNVESATEVLMVIKTSAPSSRGAIDDCRLHSYEVPELLVLPVSGVRRPILRG